MADWKPGDLCQVKRGKRWVDAEVMTAVPWAFMLAVGDRSVRILELDISTSVRPRPAPRGKLPEPYRIDDLPPRVFEADTRLGASEAVADPRLKADEAFVFSRPVPKPTTARSLAYLAHVRRHPCCSCGTTEAIHAHHVASGGMGAKASDYLAAPLCGVCHQHWHATATLPACGDTLGSRLAMWESAARCLEEWVTREGER